MYVKLPWSTCVHTCVYEPDIAYMPRISVHLLSVVHASYTSLIIEMTRTLLQAEAAESREQSLETLLMALENVEARLSLDD